MRRIGMTGSLSGAAPTLQAFGTFKDIQRESRELSMELDISVIALDPRRYTARFRVLGHTANNADEVRRLVTRLRPAP